MNRWNIRTLAFYSHDGRRRDIDLDVGEVNILTGESHTGKSALVEMLDYCLGAGECHLPGIVRDAVSWVGAIWERGSERFAVARQVPTGSATAVNSMYWRKGSKSNSTLLPISTDGLTATGSRDAVMHLVEQAFGIAEVQSETFTPDRSGVSVTARHTIPYVLQDDDVIISKISLLRGAADERRQHIVETLPYFFGISDEVTAALEAEYRRMNKQIRSEERRIAELQRLTTSEQDRAFGLVQEAAELGLCESLANIATLEDALARLATVAHWTPGQPAADGSSQLEELYARESDARARIATLRARIRAAEKSLDAFAGYGSAVTTQLGRLVHVEAFKATSEATTCPVCQSNVSHSVPTVSALREAQTALSRELADVGRDRPKLDGFLTDRRAELQDAKDSLTTVRANIAVLVGESDSASQRLDLDHRRSKVVGRVSLYLDSRAAIRAPAPPHSRLADWRSRRDDLAEIIDDDAKQERLEIAQQTVGDIASEIIADLPFEEDYRGTRVYFNARKLSCGITTAERAVPMRDVGSDENYLSLHVSILAALHRFFEKRKSPIPGVLLFDQLSRPYYPRDKFPGEVVLHDAEGGPLKTYFDFLFREVERQSGLQVIILEHAYFADDPQFVGAVKQRWSQTGERLIPADWPRQTST